jgi:uncharacterized protein YvpB
MSTLLGQFKMLCIGFYSILATYVNLEVPLIYQYPDFPTGCESVATVELLQYFGYDISVNEFVNNYLDTISPKDSQISDFENIFDHYFVGKPTSSGGYLCNPPVVVSAVEKYFSEINEVSRSPVDLTGVNFQNLLDELAVGNPVVIWVTIDFAEPSSHHLGKSEYYYPSHTAVLSGYDVENNTVFITDSISGYTEIDYSLAKHIYDTVGKKSFVVR